MSSQTLFSSRVHSGSVCSSSKSISTPSLLHTSTHHRLHTCKQRVLYCATGEGEKFVGNTGSVVRTNATSLAGSSVSAPSCPWPRQDFSGGGLIIKQPPGVLGAVSAFWRELQRQDPLPADVEHLANFTDGPGVNAEAEAEGWASLWRHQGLKF